MVCNVMAAPSLLFHAVFAVEVAHLLCIDKDQHHEYIDGTLLCKPETELVTAQLDGIELFHKQNPATERNHKPNHHQRNHQFDVFRPVGFGIFFIFERHTNVLRSPLLSLYWSVVNQTEGRGVLDVGRWQSEQAGKAEAKQRDWQRLKPPKGSFSRGG